ncbi:hypothetical protein P280DRAFT_544889 [Massarina eburnea CBS 473.64]|uniref:Uncharacterized protein n=1 Tax=Massarina eburnea CBS 473.64 TaxID=1395130 RepID=A0A6A6SK22_9PLEO|nr:hypothetical protein P280DRAFT_544889 [Massarina eburnea CBS 473.64]
MIPGAGLYLPYSAHRIPDAQPKPQSSVQKFFHRISSTQSQDMERKSINSSRASSEDVARTFTSLPTIFDLADYASTHSSVSSESEVFISLIQRVQQDVTEASRLYTSKAVTDFLESWPDTKTRIDTTITDIQRALNDIGMYVKAVRVSGDDGSPVSLRRKFEWVLSHHKKIIDKEYHLTVCHNSLMMSVQAMQTAEINSAFSGQDPAMVHEVPNRPWTDPNRKSVLRSPYSRQRARTSMNNLSLPSITVSEVGGSKVEVPAINSGPMELPGSTPDDLPDPETWDLYAPIRARSLSVGDPPTSPTSPYHRQEFSSRMQPVDTHTQKNFNKVRPLPTASVLMRPNISPAGRPRVYSDKIQQFEMKSSASFDQYRPMPTVNEKPLERYDTTASVRISDASTVPVTAKRVRPREINVRKMPPRVQSLPKELPYVSSSGSLMDELAQWVVSPGARTSVRSPDTNKSLFTATPTTSGGSSPISPEKATSTTNSAPPPSSPNVNTPTILQDTAMLIASPISALPEPVRPSPTTYSLFPSQPNTPGFPSRTPSPLPRDLPHVEIPAAPPVLRTKTTNIVRKETPLDVLDLTLPSRYSKQRRASPVRLESMLVSSETSTPTSALTPLPRLSLPPLPPSRSGAERSRSTSPIPGPHSRRRRATRNIRRLTSDLKEEFQADPVTQQRHAKETIGIAASTSEPAHTAPEILLKEDNVPEPTTLGENHQSEVSTGAIEGKAVGLRPRVALSPSKISRKPLPMTPFPGSENHDVKPNDKDPVPVTAYAKRRAAHMRRMRAFTNE